MKYGKKPVVVEAIRWNVPDENGKVLLAQECKDHPAVRPTSYIEVSNLVGTSGCSKELPHWDWAVLGIIDTLEGKHLVSPGDYIIKGIQGEFYPCKPDIFEQTYEPVKEKRYVYYVSFHSGALSGGVVTRLNKKLDDEEPILQLAKSLEKELKVTPIIINNFILLKEEFINE